MIIVTGATGGLGSAVVDQLLERVPAERVGVSVRDPDRAAGLAARGVRVRRGDFDDPATLTEAFAGAEQVLIVSVDAIGEEALRRHRAAIDAAAAAGARRVLYTSHMGADPASAFAPMPDHAETEAHLERTGVPFTSLRNGFYASTTLRLLGQAVETGVLAAPADGPVSWTAHADLAEAAAAALAGDAGLDGRTPPLTASEALDLADVAAIVSALTGREIRRVVVPDADFADGLVDHGVPEPQARMLVGMFVAARAGEFAAADPALERMLGRPPTALRAVLADRLGATSEADV